jgi:hypothetical protein
MVQPAGKRRSRHFAPRFRPVLTASLATSRPEAAILSQPASFTDEKNAPACNTKNATISTIQPKSAECGFLAISEDSIEAHNLVKHV